MTRALKSSRPAEEPALITTMSADSRAASVAWRMAWKSSATISPRSVSAPQVSARAPSMRPLNSMSSPD